ncbi:unnamed protein product [Brugia timori]|uniref:Uncharacterized protein n=1 Tax=Brugia timori TaxID=42155 RepID=A0A0R3QHC4_9BILA|nr:unnamed protein product [Brugia timori]
MRMKKIHCAKLIVELLTWILKCLPQQNVYQSKCQQQFN